MGGLVPKSELLVKYLVERLSGRLSKTKLVKLVYLADLHSRELRGKPITELKYRWHHYGPWDNSIEDVLKRMQEEGSIVCETVEFPEFGSTGYQYSNGPKRPEGQLTSGEMRIAALVVQRYSRKGLKRLLEDVVYQTPPMKDAIKRKASGQLLRMSMTDNGSSGQFQPFTYDEIAESIERVKSGEVEDPNEAEVREGVAR